MVAAKVAPEVILEKIRTSPCNFDTFPPVLAELKSEGVPDSVLLAMVRAPNGPSGAEQDAREEVTLHPVSEVIKYSGNYVKTREGCAAVEHEEPLRAQYSEHEAAQLAAPLARADDRWPRKRPAAAEVDTV